MAIIMGAPMSFSRSEDIAERIEGRPRGKVADLCAATRGFLCFGRRGIDRSSFLATAGAGRTKTVAKPQAFTAI